MEMKEKLEWGPLAGFVPNKRLPVYNWMYFKEGFSRDLVWKLLEEWKVRGLVLDPYCGSGTALLACKEKGVDSVGLDQLPIALLASRVKTRDFDCGELREQAAGLFEKRFEKVQEDCPFKRLFNKHTLEDVLFFRRGIQGLDEGVKGFFLLALINSAMRVSWTWKDGNVLKVRKHPVPPFRKFFRKRVMRMIKELEKFEGKGRAEVKKTNPWDSGLPKGSVEAVITSPPYLQQIDYSRVYSVENWLLGEECGMEQYIGPEKERRYFEDMEKMLKEMHRACKKPGRAGIVVGNAYFSKEDRIVESDRIIAEIGEKMGFRAREILVLNKRFALQRRTIKRGVLRESLVVLEK